MKGAGDLERLEQRVARSLGIRIAGRRLLESIPAIVQIVVAVLVSYSIAHFALGHATPVLAVTVTVSALGFNRDARPVRVLRQVFGILLGVALGTGILAIAGPGLWQLALVLVVVMGLGRLIVADPAFAVAAALPAALTVLLPTPEGGPYVRALDGLVGGVVALAMTALIPRDVRRVAERDGRALYSVLVEATNGVADALRDADVGAGELALARLRRTQALVDAWTESLESARAIARISPFLRSRLPELDRAARALRGGDNAARHLRLIARRSEFMVREGRAHPALAGLVSEVATAIRLLGDELADLELAGAARSLLTDLAARLDPTGIVPDGGVAGSALVLQLRPLVVDLLVATGLPLDAAQARLAPL